MSEDLRSILPSTAVLSAAAIAALVLTVLRDPGHADAAARQRFVRLLLLAVAVQAVHFAEELLTGLNEALPELLGLRPVSTGLFVTFNLVWIAVWLACALGVPRPVRAAFFPIWFLAIAMIANGLIHPALALAARGYFAGLITSLPAGLCGLALGWRLWALTREPAKQGL